MCHGGSGLRHWVHCTSTNRNTVTPPVWDRHVVGVSSTLSPHTVTFECLMTCSLWSHNVCFPDLITDRSKYRVVSKVSPRVCHPSTGSHCLGHPRTFHPDGISGDPRRKDYFTTTTGRGGWCGTHLLISREEWTSAVPHINKTNPSHPTLSFQTSLVFFSFPLSFSSRLHDLLCRCVDWGDGPSEGTGEGRWSLPEVSTGRV